MTKKSSAEAKATDDFVNSTSFCLFLSSRLTSTSITPLFSEEEEEKNEKLFLLRKSVGRDNIIYTSSL